MSRKQKTVSVAFLEAYAQDIANSLDALGMAVDRAIIPKDTKEALETRILNIVKKVYRPFRDLL